MVQYRRYVQNSTVQRKTPDPILFNFKSDLVISSHTTTFLSACQPEKVDLVFLLAPSASSTLESFEKMKTLALELLDEADIDSGNVGVGVYSAFSETQWSLQDFTNKAELLEAFDDLPFQGAIAINIGSAILVVRNKIFIPSRGDRENVKNVLVVMTDGLSAGDPGPMSDAVRSDGIHIYAVGIGLSYTAELDEIANKPSGDNVFTVHKGFGALERLEQQIFGEECGKFKHTN